MEKKKNTIISMSTSFRSSFDAFVLDLFLTNLTVSTPAELEKMITASLLSQRGLSLPVTILLWLAWFLEDQFSPLFTTKGSLLRSYSSIVARGCAGLWRSLFAYIGNRGLVGWRRIALKSFLVKQRFVTRYNYRRVAHYFWRRKQRRWRLFKTRRRAFFFRRRYRKLRRLRYNLSFNFAWRATMRLPRLDVRHGSTRTRIFIRELLRWRAYLIGKRLGFGAAYRVRFWRAAPVFSAYRYRSRYFPVRVRQNLLAIGLRQRLWRHKTRAAVAWRFFTPRSFRGKRAFRATPSAGIYRLGRRSFSFPWRSRYRRLLRRTTLTSMFNARRRLRFIGKRALRWKKKKRRWYPPRVWRRKRRVLRRFRRILRPWRRMRVGFRRHFAATRIRKRLRRRLKRRKKRRRKYRLRWVNRFRRGRRRRRRARFRKIARLPRLSRLAVMRRRFGSFKSRFLKMQGAIPGMGLRFRHVEDLAISPLLAVKRLQARWTLSLVPRTRFDGARAYQRQLRMRHSQWREGDLPVYHRVTQFRRWRKTQHFGRYRRWLCSLFINGQRHSFYKEKKFPIAKNFIIRRSSVALPLGNLQIASAVGAAFRTGRTRALRRRFLFRLRRYTASSTSRRIVFGRRFLPATLNRPMFRKRIKKRLKRRRYMLQCRYSLRFRFRRKLAVFRRRRIFRRRQQLIRQKKLLRTQRRLARRSSRRQRRARRGLIRLGRLVRRRGKARRVHLARFQYTRRLLRQTARRRRRRKIDTRKRRNRRFFSRRRRRRLFRRRQRLSFYFRRRKLSQLTVFRRRRPRQRKRFVKQFRRLVFVRHFYRRTKRAVRWWLRLQQSRWWWQRRLIMLRRVFRRRQKRRIRERVMWKLVRARFLFRIRFLQVRRRVSQTRLQQFRLSRVLKRGLVRQVAFFVRARRVRRFAFLVRSRFRTVFFSRLQVRLQHLHSTAVADECALKTPYFVQGQKTALFGTRVRQQANRRAVFGLVQLGRSHSRRRSVAYRVSRYIAPRGAGLFKAHVLLTRRYPSVYDFETFNYLFSSDFLYTRFTQQGNRLRSQLIVMSVLRYLRPYSSFHLVRFIERFLVGGFPIYFEMSSLKQSNKEQPFPVPINLKFFRNYMLKAIATRFRSRRQAVSFQAALLAELWSWHVDPTQSILHEFLVNHYAVGMDSRFFVHYRWRVKR